MVAIPFATQSFPSDSVPLSSERLVNLFAELQPEGAKSRLLVRSTPGLTTVNTLPESPVRAMTVQRTEWYAVAGNSLYRVSTTGAVTLCGTFAGDADTANATMAASSTQVAVCVPPYLYVWNSSTNVFALAGSPLPDVSSVCFVDGFFVASEAGGGGRFWVSNAYDALTFDALSFATTESNPDFILRAVALRSEVWFIGQRSIEVWDSVGGQFPFQRNSGASSARGCRSGRSVAVGDNSVFWVGDDFMVYRSHGYSPVRISTWALEQALLRAGDVNQALGFCINYAGHVQYVLTFGVDGQTWVYDVPSGMWHERTTSSGTGRWRGTCSVRFGENALVGDRNTGKVFKLDATVGTEDGFAMARIATLPPVFAGNRRAFMSRLELLVETGTGSSNDVTLSLSDDGGRTFRDISTQSTGPGGSYRKRLFWTRLGSFRERTLRFSFDGAGRVAIYGAEADVAEGAV